MPDTDTNANAPVRYNEDATLTAMYDTQLSTVKKNSS